MIQDEIEHHALLTVDEPDMLARLFKKGTSKLTIDIRGRTSKNKSRGALSELGIKKLSHTFLTVYKDGVELSSAEDLNELLKSYRQEGADNLYVVRLVVEWPDGDMQEWKRHVVHANDSMKRKSHSGRLNALTIKLGKFQDVAQYQDKYGSDLVKPTICEINQVQHKKRVCLGTMAGGA